MIGVLCSWCEMAIASYQVVLWRFYCCCEMAISSYQVVLWRFYCWCEMAIASYQVVLWRFYCWCEMAIASYQVVLWRFYCWFWVYASMLRFHLLLVWDIINIHLQNLSFCISSFAKIIFFLYRLTFQFSSASLTFIVSEHAGISCIKGDNICGALDLAVCVSLSSTQLWQIFSFHEEM